MLSNREEVSRGKRHLETYLDDRAIMRRMGEVTRDCWQCDICGFIWLKGPRTPDRCGSQKCRSALWNRPRKSVSGRPDKGMVKVKQRMSPTLDSEGNHHPLCSCLLCLTATWRDTQPRKGRIPGKGDSAECLRGKATGMRSNPRRPKITERQRGQLGDALVRAGCKGVGVGVVSPVMARLDG
jgi:hypothetical protein